MATIFGTNGNNNINGTVRDDYIDARGGNDTVRANSGDDEVYGGSGNDKLAGDNGDDYLDGGIGNDTLNGGFNDDTYVGGAGRDKFGWAVGGAFTDSSDTILDFQQGSDKISLGNQRTSIYDFLDDNGDGVLDGDDRNVSDYGRGLELDLSGYTGHSVVLDVQDQGTLFFSDFVA